MTNKKCRQDLHRGGKWIIYSEAVGSCLYLSDLHVEGLFRVPGNSIRQQALREILNSGADVDLDTGDYHPHDVATLLKAFLGELPEPLLTHRHYHAHLKIAGTPLRGWRFTSVRTISGLRVVTQILVGSGNFHIYSFKAVVPNVEFRELQGSLIIQFHYRNTNQPLLFNDHCVCIACLVIWIEWI